MIWIPSGREVPINILAGIASYIYLMHRDHVSGSLLMSLSFSHLLCLSHLLRHVYVGHTARPWGSWCRRNNIAPEICPRLPPPAGSTLIRRDKTPTQTTRLASLPISQATVLETPELSGARKVFRLPSPSRVHRPLAPTLAAPSLLLFMLRGRLRTLSSLVPN